MKGHVKRALRGGPAARGLIELRQSFTNGGDLFNHFFWPVLMLVALFFLRDRHVRRERVPARRPGAARASSA